MNVYGGVVLAALLAVFLIERLASFLNVRALSNRIPPEFQGLYSPEKYASAQAYARERARFGAWSASFDLLKILAFWFSGGFQALDGWLRAQSWSDLTTGLAYIGILALGNSLLSLPFDVYATFVIEAKYGFNKTTWRTFLADRLKGYVLAALLGGPLLALVLYFFQWAGPAAWLYVWAAAAAFTLAIQFIAPTWIMPLFNKFTPLTEGELHADLMNYARSVDFPLKGIYVMDGSKRSSKGNAFFTGFGQNKRIALFDTLIAQHTVPELVAVLAHEIGHYKMKHVIKSLVLTLLHFGVLAYLMSLFLNSPGLFQAFYLRQPSVYAGLVLFGLLYTPVSFVLSVVLNLYSRHNEFEADRYSAETYKNPAAMKEALKKLSVATLSNLEPHPFYVFLTYTHPPVLQRIQALR